MSAAPGPSARHARAGALAAAALLGASLASAQQNLSFEAAGEELVGWGAFGGRASSGDATVAADDTTAFSGARSLKIEQRGAAALARIAQRVPVGALADGVPMRPDSALRVRLTATVRQGPGNAQPEIWLRVGGATGGIYVDGLGEGGEPASAEGTGATGADAGWTERVLELPLVQDADEIAFGAVLRGDGGAWFDDFRVTVLDAADRPPATAGARRYLDDALDTLEQHSIRRAAVDWPAVRAAAARHARGAQDAADTYVALRYAIYALGDRHSYLQPPRAAALLARAPVSNARTGRAVVPPTARSIDGRFGYLAVPGFAGGTQEAQMAFAGELQSLIKGLESTSTCGWILDLRLNSGGNLWPMLAGVGPLLGEGEVGASVYPDGRRVPVWYRHGQAGFGEYVQLRVFTPHPAVERPVAVLIGPGTASSGEVLAAAFRGQPGARSFGAPTSGVSSGNRTFPLADGAALVLTVAATSDRSGHVQLGPLVPEQTVSASETGDGEDPVLAAAAAWLSGEAGCAVVTAVAASGG